MPNNWSGDSSDVSFEGRSAIFGNAPNTPEENIREKRKKYGANNQTKLTNDDTRDTYRSTARGKQPQQYMLSTSSTSAPSEHNSTIPIWSGVTNRLIPPKRSGQQPKSILERPSVPVPVIPGASLSAPACDKEKWIENKKKTRPFDRSHSPTINSGVGKTNNSKVAKSGSARPSPFKPLPMLRKRTHDESDGDSDFVSTENLNRRHTLPRAAKSKKLDDTIDLRSDDDYDDARHVLVENDNHFCQQVEDCRDFMNIVRDAGAGLSRHYGKENSRYLTPLRAYAKAIFVQGRLYFPKKRSCRIDLGSDERSIDFVVLNDFDENEHFEVFLSDYITINQAEIIKVSHGRFFEHGRFIKLEVRTQNETFFPDHCGQDVVLEEKNSRNDFDIIIFTDDAQVRVILEMVIISMLLKLCIQNIYSSPNFLILQLYEFTMPKFELIFSKSKAANKVQSLPEPRTNDVFINLSQLVSLFSDIENQHLILPTSGQMHSLKNNTDSRRRSTRKKPTRVEIGQDPSDAIVALQYPFEDGSQVSKIDIISFNFISLLTE